MPPLIRYFFIITTLLAVLVGPAIGGNTKAEHAKAENAKADNEWVFPREDKRFSATFGEISTSLVFGDIDGDGKTDVVYGTSNGYIFAVKLGENHYRHIRVGQSVKVTPILIDFDRKGHPDILAFGRDADLDEPAKKSRLFVIDGETFAKKADIVLDGSIVSPPALADFNGDGKVDVLVAARGLVLVDGAFEKSGSLHLFPTNGVSYASPVVEDFNDDGIYDFMYVHTEKNVPYLDVYLSTGENFEYEKLTFRLKHEVRVTPTLIKQKEGETIVWKLIAPTINNRIDFYNLSWNEKKGEMSLQLEKQYGTNDYKFTAQLPALWTKGRVPVLYLSQPGKKDASQSNAVNAVINTTLNAFTGESLSMVYADKA
ncbi:MAG: VCBS repeat-containing protein, partial [Nitrospirae bacterium]|nr:VCBS repeat-containing protein [Nitrospirota bacterium]